MVQGGIWLRLGGVRVIHATFDEDMQALHALAFARCIYQVSHSKHFFTALTFHAACRCVCLTSYLCGPHVVVIRNVSAVKQSAETSRNLRVPVTKKVSLHMSCA
jgi:hypothetical protein